MEGNIQHPTSNTQHPIIPERRFFQIPDAETEKNHSSPDFTSLPSNVPNHPYWTLDVRPSGPDCWMWDVSPDGAEAGAGGSVFGGGGCSAKSSAFSNSNFRIKSAISASFAAVMMCGFRISAK
jgi:hypothetical protein